MKINCERKKTNFKNLTVNKEYDAVEDGEVFVVTNDAGFRARYAKNYFRVLPEVPATRNLLDLLTVTYEGSVLEITLNRTTRTVDLEVSTSTISCGIDEIKGISILKRTVNEMYAAKMANVVGTKAEMFTAILNKVFEELREEDNRMCWLLSDEITEVDAELNAVLDEMSSLNVDNSTGINPNNGHTIGLWVIK